MWKVTLPQKIPISKRSYFSLNLNVYRNAHYQTLNKAKAAFKELVRNEVAKLPFFEHARIRYVLYLPSARRCDISNIGSVTDKFFSDALVELGHLKDDNYEFLPEIEYVFGGIDKDNPRTEAYIEEIK